MLYISYKDKIITKLTGKIAECLNKKIPVVATLFGIDPLSKGVDLKPGRICFAFKVKGPNMDDSQPPSWLPAGNGRCVEVSGVPIGAAYEP